MTNIDTNKMYGVVDGVILCNMGRTQELSDRMFSRNVPSQVLQSQFSMRPVSTKYATMPIMDQRSQCKEPIQQVPVYNTKTQFNPGTAQSPWSGFATNINTESELRNQVYALQKCSQAVYVPKSKSDLYDYKFQTKTQPNPHQLLFSDQTFQSFNPNPDNNVCGVGLFNNSTRSQIKDMTKQNC